jgi:hypothetical protein
MVIFLISASQVARITGMKNPPSRIGHFSKSINYPGTQLPETDITFP